MAKYKVCFSGYAYVEASNEDFAILAYEEGDTVYEDVGVDSVEEVDDFIVDF